METKKCPACNNQLKLPSEYFDAVGNIKKETEKFRSVLILDFILNNLTEIKKELEETGKLEDVKVIEDIWNDGGGCPVFLEDIIVLLERKFSK